MWFTWFNNSNTNITTDTTAAGYYGGIECGFGNYNGGQIIIINDNNNTQNTKCEICVWWFGGGCYDYDLFEFLAWYLCICFFFCKYGTAQQGGGNGGVNGGGQGK